MRKPENRVPSPDPRLNLSYAELGVIAEPGRLIEVRAPDEEKGDWPRIYLTPRAARQLQEWLGMAYDVAVDSDPPNPKP